MASLGDSIRHGTKWLMFGRVNQQALQFIFGVALARILVPEDFGMLVTIQIFTGFASYFAGGGMGQALIRTKELKPHYYDVVFSLQFFICIVIYGVFFFLAPLIAHFFQNELYTDLVRISALTFLLRPLVNIPKAFLQREMRFKAIAISGIITFISSGIASIYMALNGFGPLGLVLGGIAGSLTNIIILKYVTRMNFHFNFDMIAAKQLAGYGIKISITEIIPYILSQVSNVIISRALGPAALGLYNKSDSLRKLPSEIIAGSAYQTVFRALSKIQDNLDQSRYIYLRTITLLTTYTLPLYVGLFLLAEPFIIGIYGEKWAGAIIPLKILVIAGIFRCLNNPSGAVIAAQDKLTYEIKIQLEASILLVGGCLFALQWGINGIAWAIVISSFYITLRMISLASRCIGGNLFSVLKALVPAILLSILMLTGMYAVDIFVLYEIKTTMPLVYLVVSATIGMIIYMTGFLFIPIKELKKESRRWKTLLRIPHSQE